MNIVILLGAPGSGKGTVAAKLAAEDAALCGLLTVYVGKALFEERHSVEYDAAVHL